ncbi:MAG: hypothetical protein LBS49_02650, partial [Candidatus Accumulibacter sp.]|nr:hypothetical protein [Accumulibacter sp.]
MSFHVEFLKPGDGRWRQTLALLALALCCASSAGAETFSELLDRAERNEAAAQFELGRRHERGEIVGTHYAEAVRWYQKAAEQGYAEAQFALG